MFTSGVEAIELVVNAGLLLTVGIEDALALSSGGGAAVALVVGTVAGEFGIGDFAFTEFFLFLTVSDLLFL